MRIALKADPSGIELAYADTAPPFDPIAHHARSAIDLDAAFTDRPIGRVGIALVVGMALRAHYVREDGWNRLILTLQRQA